MGSLLISDVAHHFPHTMFGGVNPHQDSSSIPPHHRSAPLIPQQQSSSQQQSDASTDHRHRVAGSSDVQMADVAASQHQPPVFRSHSHQPPTVSTAASTSTSSSTENPTTQPQFTPTASVASAPTLPQTIPSSTGGSTQTSPAAAAFRSPAQQPVPASPRKIKVKNLLHIQSFVNDESSPFSQTRSISRRTRRDPSDVGPQYEISEMPVSDIIEMVAGLLTKITTTNDRQHEHLHRQIPPQDNSRSLSSQTTSVLAFHGKNVPSISILSYLSRIHKYCPTTYEVFLSLLVYFDRMTERVNAGPMMSLRQANQQSLERAAARAAGSRQNSVSSSDPIPSSQSTTQPSQNTAATTPPPSGSLGEKAPKQSPDEQQTATSEKSSVKQPPSPPSNVDTPLDLDPYNLSHFFVVDSFNIHRLVIAGVTCASKFFSDVFYTNSRYAKVGGLPLVELNHLELQFLILNDFRLAVPLEEMAAYGTMLVEFYAREVAAQNQLPSTGAGAGGSSAAGTPIRA